PRLRPLRRRNGNLGFKLHLCVRSEKLLEARAFGVVVKNFVLALTAVILCAERRFAGESAFGVEGPLYRQMQRSHGFDFVAQRELASPPGPTRRNRGPSTALWLREAKPQLRSG